MNVTVTPGGFENVQELTQVCDEFGITVSVPPLSDEEVERIIAQQGGRVAPPLN